MDEAVAAARGLGERTACGANPIGARDAPDGVLLGAAARACERGEHEAAALLYQEVLDGGKALSSQARVELLARQVLAWSWVDPLRAEELALGLPAVDNDGDDVDADTLERSTQVSPPSSLPSSQRRLELEFELVLSR